MASRALAFSDPEVIRLISTRFVPVAENCSPLQRQQDAKGEFFRLVAEQGHYAGRVVPSATRQGIYAHTADGVLLASINTRDGAKMLGMIQTALERWQQQAAEVGQAVDDYVPDPRHRSLYPEGGLVLRVTSRDLPRAVDTRSPDWRINALNHDYAWFTAAEARQLLPEEPRPGATHALPWPLVRRFALYHLLDNVRGETPAWREQDIEYATVMTTVRAVDGERVTLDLHGAMHVGVQGTWAVRPCQEPLRDQERGYDCQLQGTLVYDLGQERFTRFDALASGERWGGSEHNCRWDDLGKAPMGIAFELAGDEPRDRTPPHANLWRYFDLPAPP